jgi:hypothetical protein
MDVFSAYVRLWALVNLLRIHIGMNAGTGLVGSTLDRGALVLPILICAAGMWPRRLAGALPFMAMLVRALTNLAKGSMMSNSQMWATQMDAAVMLALVARLTTRRRSSLLDVLSAEDERSVVGACGSTIRWQLAIFYFASGFWKVNSSFLHPDYSCASIFTVQPLEYLPDRLLFATDGTIGLLLPALARTIAATGPAMTLLIEAVVPALHALDPAAYPLSASVGVLATLVFHLVIGLTPPPSNVSTFGVTTCLRLYFVLPDGLAAALSELCTATRRGVLLGTSMAAGARPAIEFGS